MTSSTSVIVEARRGGRPLLQTADSLLRSRTAPARTFVAISNEGAPVPLLESVTIRLNASTTGALNAALRSIDTRYVLFIPAGHMLDDVCLEESEAAFERDAAVAAIAAPLRLQTTDATRWLEWRPGAATAAAVLNDTRGVPAVFAVRREVCEALGGFDETFGDLSAYEFWLRLTLAGHRVAVLDRPLVARDIAPAGDEPAPGQAPPGGPPHSDAARHLTLFRAILEKHAAAIEPVMHELLVAREIRFGRMRETHRELTARRDAGLAELDRVRAESSHLRAYIAHHGRDATDWGDLRRTDPISRDWGYDRGIPVDRRHIADFLAAHSSDIRGAILEVQEDELTRAFGGARVTESSVLDVDADNGRATIFADLRAAPNVPADRYDCIILTQTLHVIDDMAAVLRECHRILKPGGVLLATIPAASRVCLEYGRDGDFWRATPAGARALFRSAFAPATVAAAAFGNVLTNVAFLEGMATNDLQDSDFTTLDPYFPALTGVRARKGTWPSGRTARGVVLLYHRVEDASDRHDLSVPPALFAAHLDWLRRECSVVPLEALLASPPESLPERAVALTFDDGYLDNLETVAPLLQDRQLPAAFFLTTRWLEETGEYWWDALARAGLPEDEAVPLHDRMVHAPLERRDEMLRSIASSPHAAPRVRPMRSDEVRRLAAYPNVTIGAHSVNHLALPDQPAGIVRREIDEAGAALTRLVGKPVTLFAYPYGAYDRACAAAVRASCRWGFSCDDRPLTESFDAATVPRLEVKRWEVAELAARVTARFRLPPVPSVRASSRRAVW